MKGVIKYYLTKDGRIVSIKESKRLYCDGENFFCFHPEHNEDFLKEEIVPPSSLEQKHAARWSLVLEPREKQATHPLNERPHYGS